MIMRETLIFLSNYNLKLKKIKKNNALRLRKREIKRKTTKKQGLFNQVKRMIMLNKK